MPRMKKKLKSQNLSLSHLLPMMPRLEIMFEEGYDQEWDPTVPNGYEMFGVSSILAYLGIHAGKQHNQTAVHLCGCEHE